jgi:periplasmic protein CpxP/Spy
MPLSVTTRIVPALLIAAGLIRACALPASAQTNTPNATPSYNSNTPESPDYSFMQQSARRRLAQLHERLAITPNEEPAWSSFARTSMENARRIDDMFRERAERVSTMDAAQNLRSWANIQTAESQDFQQLVPTFDTLYQALTPQQRQMADNLVRNSSARAEARRQNLHR